MKRHTTSPQTPQRQTEDNDIGLTNFAKIIGAYNTVGWIDYHNLKPELGRAPYKYAAFDVGIVICTAFYA